MEANTDTPGGRFRVFFTPMFQSLRRRSDGMPGPDLFGTDAPSGAPRTVRTAARHRLLCTRRGRSCLPDLKPEEVAIRVNGRPGRFSAAAGEADRSAQADPLAAQVAVTQPFGTNSSPESGRSFVLVIDDESIRLGRASNPLRAAGYISWCTVASRSRLAVDTPHGGMKVNLTSNHDRVSQASARHRPRPDNESRDRWPACRTRNALEAAEHCCP